MLEDDEEDDIVYWSDCVFMYMNKLSERKEEVHKTIVMYHEDIHALVLYNHSGSRE
jgi:ATP-dependent Zn protease